MKQATLTLENQNKEYLDLYGDCLKPFVELPTTSTFDDIKKQVDTNSTVGYIHSIKIGNRCVIAQRKFTWKSNVAKTAYLHIMIVKSFENPIVVEHWREQKNGNFKTL